jgi:arylsulfatase
MTTFTESTWTGPLMGQELEKVMKSFVQYPPRKLQSEGYTGPITISGYEKFENVRKQLKEYNIDINLGQ